MLINKWVVLNKEPVSTKAGYLYTLILVDWGVSIFKTNQHHIYSEKNLKIGDFVDCDLNPLSYHYKTENCDIATVESTRTHNITDQDSKKFLLFSNRFGCFDLTCTKDSRPFSMKRGDEISILVRNDPLHKENANNHRDFFVFRLMKNLTTDETSPYFTDNISDYGINDSQFEDLVIVGAGAMGTNKKPAKKHMLINSPRFGYISTLATSNENLFYAKPDDKLLIERNPKTNSFEILRNMTADNMILSYVLQR